MTKIAGDREVRELYRQSDLRFEDLWLETRWPLPLRPGALPFLFFFLDTEQTFEAGLQILYEEPLVKYQANDFVAGALQQAQIHQII